MNSFYTEEELKELGLKSYGKDVLISRKASIYSPSKIIIGNNVRIDDFCILSGKIEIGSNVHISAFVALYGGDEGIYFDDCSGASARTTIFALTDDFSGEYMTNSMIEEKYRNVIKGKVKIGKYAQIGANCVVLPNVIIGEGCAVGALSLVKNSLEDFTICAGVPCKKIKDRSKRLLDLAKEREEEYE